MHTNKPKIPDWYRRRVLSPPRFRSLRADTPYRKLGRFHSHLCLIAAVLMYAALVAFILIVGPQRTGMPAGVKPSVLKSTVEVAGVVLITGIPLLLVFLFSPRFRLRKLGGRCLNCGEPYMPGVSDRCATCGDDVHEQDGYRRILTIGARFKYTGLGGSFIPLTRATPSGRSRRLLGYFFFAAAVIAFGVLALYSFPQPDHEPPKDPISFSLMLSSIVLLILSIRSVERAARHDTFANLDRLAGRCFKCEASLEPHGDECPQCGAWLPIQRLYEEYLRTRCVRSQKASISVPEQAR